jgi:hypothetical protein
LAGARADGARGTYGGIMFQNIIKTVAGNDVIGLHLGVSAGGGSHVVGQRGAWQKHGGGGSQRSRGVGEVTSLVNGGLGRSMAEAWGHVGD